MPVMLAKQLVMSTKLIGRINQSQCTFPRFVIGLVPLLMLPTPTIMAERKRNRNALFLLDHKLYASDYDSDSVASENHCENRPLQAPLSRLSPARPRFSRNFSRCAFLSCSLELVKGTVGRRDWETPTSTNPSFHENRNRFRGARVQAPVVQTLGSDIHRINHYPADKY